MESLRHRFLLAAASVLLAMVPATAQTRLRGAMVGPEVAPSEVELLGLDETLANLDRILPMCTRYGVRVTLDLHTHGWDHARTDNRYSFRIECNERQAVLRAAMASNG